MEFSQRRITESGKLACVAGGKNVIPTTGPEIPDRGFDGVRLRGDTGIMPKNIPVRRFPDQIVNLATNLGQDADSKLIALEHDTPHSVNLSISMYAGMITHGLDSLTRFGTAILCELPLSNPGQHLSFRE
jgi:hypothetical protein